MTIVASQRFNIRYSVYAKTAGIYLTATVISSFLNVLINPLLAMNLSPEDYATIGYYTAYNTLFSPLMGFFLIDYFLKNRFVLSEEDLRRLKATVIKLFLYFSGFITLLCLAGLYIYITAAKVSIPFFPYAILSLLSAYFALLFAFKTAELKIDRKAKAFFRLSVVQGVFNAGCALLLVVLIKWGAFGRLTATLLVALGFFIYCLIDYRGLLKEKVNKELFVPIIKYSTPLVLAGMLGFFTTGFDKVLLERQNDLYSLGIYSVALQMSGYLNIFSTAVKTTFQPDAYEAIAQKNIRKLIKTIILNVGIISFLVLLFIVFCPLLIHLLTAGRYDASTGLSRILALSVITSTIYYQISQATYGSGLSNITLINKVIGSFLSALLFVIMIPRYGAIGAAWSVVLSFVIYAIGNVILLFINRNRFLK